MWRADVQGETALIMAEPRLRADPKRAESEASYLKSDVAERLVRDSASRVYVDHLAEMVAGALVVRHPAVRRLPSEDADRLMAAYRAR